MGRRLDWGVRAIIEHQGKLLAVKNAVEGRDFYCLPGGGAEDGEDVIEALEREIFEELGVKPLVGSLLYVHQLYRVDDNGVKTSSGPSFFFHVTNGDDFSRADLKNASHAFELTEARFIDPATTNLKPHVLSSDWTDMLASGFHWSCRTVIEEYR